MNRVSRRQVLKCAAGAAGAFGIPYLIPSGVLAADGKPGANDRVTVGAIGVGGRASLLLDQLPKDGQIVALCDCNLPRAEAFKAKRKGDWPVYQHYQKILERKDIDAVIIATQEFQRVLPSHPRLPGRQGRLRRKAVDACMFARGACSSTRCGSTVASSRSVRSSGRWP